MILRKSRWVSVFFLGLAVMMAISGCTPLVSDEEDQQGITAYASFYPIYALAEAVTAGVPDITLHCLVQPQDGCLRAYSLSDWDLYTALQADVLLMGGRGLESFADGFTALGAQGPAVVQCMMALPLIHESEEWVRGEGVHSMAGDNPWLFLSADGGLRMVEALTANMIALDPAYESLYYANCDRISERLLALHDDMVAQVADVSEGCPVALMHEGFIYPAKELGLQVACRIDRESGEMLYDAAWAEALAQLDTSGAKVVLLEQQAPPPLIRLITEAGYRVALLDTLSTHRESDGAEGYFTALTQNATAIARALQEMA